MNFKSVLKSLGFVLLGAVLFSLAVNTFAVLNGIVQGGLTGVATMLNHIFPFLPVGLSIFALNIPLFIAAKRALGNKFLFKTFFATLLFTLAIDAGSAVFPPYRGDVLLSALFCGVLSGTGLGLVLLAGATTGGTEIVALLVRQKRPFSSVGSIMLAFDLAVVAASWAVFGRLESVMYAAVTLFVSSKSIDLVLYGAGHNKLIFVITSKGESLSSKITAEVGRGLTELSVKGGYTGDEKKLLLCAARASEATLINKIIKETDPLAFTVITEAGDVFGEGFG